MVALHGGHWNIIKLKDSGHNVGQGTGWIAGEILNLGAARFFVLKSR